MPSSNRIYPRYASPVQHFKTITVIHHTQQKNNHTITPIGEKVLDKI